MRILFLSNAASIHTVRWVNALSDLGHEVHLVYKNDDEPLVDTISDKVFFHQLRISGSKGYILNATELKKLSTEIKPDIINAHYASGYGTLARLAKLKPLVLSVWGADVYDFPFQNRVNRRIIKDNLWFADNIASTSYSMANHVRTLLEDPSYKITVTPFGIDTEKFKRIDKKTVLSDDITIGIIKTLAPKYGIDDFIKAIDLLRFNLIKNGNASIAYKIRARIYGDGEQKEQLKEQINSAGLDNVITLEGKIPNTKVPDVLNDFDIFCATSVLDSESFGVAVVEAMAMEVSVVATDVSGFKEVIEDGKSGIIVERNNPVMIAEALEKLVLDGDLRGELGRNGRERVEKLYKWDDNVNLMLNLYRETIE